MPKIRVQVTERNIVLGNPHSEDSCPVALALKDAGVIDPLVTDCIHLHDRYVALADVELPYEVRQFINDFDKDVEVDPFEFEVDIPAECLKELQPCPSLR